MPFPSTFPDLFPGVETGAESPALLPSTLPSVLPGVATVVIEPPPPPVYHPTGQIILPDTSPLAWWVPRGDRNPNNHGTRDVYQALTGRLGSRNWSFRYELLDKNHQRIMDLDEVIACKVVHQYLADIKRQATFTIRDEGRVNYLSDRIRPFVRLHLTPLGASDWVEWPLGVFLLASPTRHADEYDIVSREVEGFDPLQALGDDAVSARYSVAAGANVVQAAYSLISSVVPVWKYTRSAEVLTATKEWPPGTSKRTIANELLGIAEFESVSFDSEGVGILKPYQSPDERAPMWTYAYGSESLMIPDVDQELDLFSVPNKWIGVISQPDQPLLVASYTNANPSSPTSTVRRGRTIVEVHEDIEATTSTMLSSKIRRMGFEASQIYEHLTFETSIMPMHGTNDVLKVEYDPLGISARYAETSWTITCDANASMQHEARRIVSI